MSYPHVMKPIDDIKSQTFVNVTPISSLAQRINDIQFKSITEWTRQEVIALLHEVKIEINADYGVIYDHDKFMQQCDWIKSLKAHLEYLNLRLGKSCNQ